MVDGDGGAYSIGRAALNAVLRSYDETGAIDEFGEIVLTAMASRSIDECLRWTCRLGSAAAIHTGISELSKVVMAAQVRGNDRARSLLDQGAEQAVRLLEIGLNRCPLGESFDLGLYGGVVQYSEYIAKALHDSLRSRFPRARVQLAAARPLAGVVWSVLEPLGHSDFHKWLSSAAEGVPASQRGFLLPSFAYSLSQ
jgi:N-acetylglucosamine kinase-like BadF-type ATPase